MGWITSGSQEQSPACPSLAGHPQPASTLCLPTTKLQQETDEYFDKGIAVKYLILAAGFFLCSTWNMYVGGERFETHVKLGR